VGKISRVEREFIARKRLLRILENHGVANARTLEQKISDAGPNPQRVDPHILTSVRNALVSENRLVKLERGNTTWFHRRDADPAVVERRLAEQLNVFREFTDRKLVVRTGQVLEIATFRALLMLPEAEFFGRFTDLEEHGDEALYTKQEPPQHIGCRCLPGKKNLDFILRSPFDGFFGIECKNSREWLYPDRPEIIELIEKCLALDCVPVLIARRIPYVTFYLLKRCGVIIHQTFSQLLPASAEGVADRAKHKRLLGYHDIRTGNVPDGRLITFITRNLMPLAASAKAKYELYRDLLEGFASREIKYKEFAARVRRRDFGQEEDNDWPNGDPADWVEE